MKSLTSMKGLTKLIFLTLTITLCCCASAYANTYTSLYNQSDLLAAPGGGLNLMIYTFGQYSRVFIPPGTIGISMTFIGNVNALGSSVSRFGRAPDSYSLPVPDMGNGAKQLDAARTANIYSTGPSGVGIVNVVTQNYYTPLSADKAGWFYMDAYMTAMQYLWINITVDVTTYTAWYNTGNNASNIDCPCAQTGTCCSGTQSGSVCMCSAAACSTLVTPAFTASSTSATAGQTVSFTNTSTPFNASAAWLWTVLNSSGGTVTTGTSQNFQYTFPSAGNYTVKLTSTPTDTNCSPSTTPTQTISVSQQQQCTNPVTADFTINNSTGTVTVTSGNAVSFNNTSSGNATYSWTFGDGISSASQSPAHTYTNTGTSSVTYTVTLTATPTTTGCSNQSKTQYVTVNPAPVCTPALTAQFNITPNNTDGTSAAVIYADRAVIFTNTSTKIGGTLGTLAADSDAKSWSWTVKNNSGVIVDMATSYNFPVAFPDPGNYTITLTATDLKGCVSQPFTQTVTAVSLCGTTPITESFSVNPPANIKAGQSITFTSTSKANTANATLKSQIWDFGDGSQQSTLQSPTHAYAYKTATYTVSLQSTDSNGCSNANPFTQPITVNATTPAVTASFSVPDNIIVNQAANFTNTSLPLNITGVNWAWNATPKSPNSNSSPTISSKTSKDGVITFSGAGTYTVTLMATDSIINTSQSVVDVTVNPAVTASFDVPANISGQPVTFTNKSSTLPTGYTWAWAVFTTDTTPTSVTGGTMDQTNNYTIQFPKAATYTVTLKAQDSSNNVIAESQVNVNMTNTATVVATQPTDLTVSGITTASSTTGIIITSDETVKFTKPATGWTLSAVNNATSTILKPTGTDSSSFNFPAAGTYTVTLTDGTVTTQPITKTVTVSTPICPGNNLTVDFGMYDPIPTLVANTTDQYIVTFKNKSVPINNLTLNAVQWSWDFGDPYADSIKNPNTSSKIGDDGTLTHTYSYSKQGVYYITLTATTPDNTCNFAMRRALLILPPPINDQLGLEEVIYILQVISGLR